MSTRELTWAERSLLKLVQWGNARRDGYVIAFAEELIRHHGIRGFFRWARETEAALVEVTGFFGDEDGHLMSSFASFWNGCDYCAYGHMVAHNIHYFHRTGQLFVIDEGEVEGLMRLTDQAVLENLGVRFADPAFARKLALVKRLHALRGVEGPLESPEDTMLLKCNGIYEWINECSIVAHAPSPPLGKVAKDKALLERYRLAREASLTAAAKP